VSISEFQHQIFKIAWSSSICDVPEVRRISPTSITIRVPITPVNFIFIEIFFNEQTDRVSFALIQEGQRIYGADNTGGWHIHPFDNPSNHKPIATAMSFQDFLNEITPCYSQFLK